MWVYRACGPFPSLSIAGIWGPLRTQSIGPKGGHSIVTAGGGWVSFPGRSVTKVYAPRTVQRYYGYDGWVGVKLVWESGL